MRNIGTFTPSSPFLLAPLAGITDSVTRTLCHEQGAGLTYTEMVSVNGMNYGDKNTVSLLHIGEDEGPVAIQVFGSNPESIAKAVSKYDYLPNLIWDINMGCPVPKVVKNGEGSALMKTPDIAGEIVEAVVKVTDKPVTCKIRAGWDEKSINAPEVAKVLEQAGASAVAVHGRTREQYYTGKADRNIIKSVKEAVDIPVIGNGDIFTKEDGFSMMEETGCDMVMVARGSLGNPWIFSGISPSKEEKKEMMIRHLTMLVDLKGEYAAVRQMRKHVGWYIKGMKGAAGIRRKINGITDTEKMKRCIEEI